MNDLSTLKVENILFGLDCMISFAEFVGDRQYGVDLGSGTVTAGEDAAPISVVGSWAAPPTASWLWGWANPGWKDLPAETLAASHELRELGHAGGIQEFTSSEISMDDDSFGFHVTAIACGLTSAAGAMQYKHPGGSAFFTMPSLPSGRSDQVSRHLRVIAQGIEAYDVAHRPAIRAYLSKLGYELIEDRTQLVAERPDAQLTVSFDVEDRVSNVAGSTGSV